MANSCRIHCVSAQELCNDRRTFGRSVQSPVLIWLSAVWRMKSCCCLCLRTGVVLINVSDLIHFILLWNFEKTIMFIFPIHDLERAYMRFLFTQDLGTAEEANVHGLKYSAGLEAAVTYARILSFIFWIACIWFASSFVMFCGNIKGFRSWMRPYVYLTAIFNVTVNICILVLTMSIADNGFISEGFCILSVTLIWTAETFFYWQVVRSRIKEINEEKVSLAERIATLLVVETQATV